MSEPVARMRDVIVIGGGCYGTFYAAQLTKAKAKGRADYRAVIVVDRDPGCRACRELSGAPGVSFVASEWDAFFDDYFAAQPARAAGAQDYIVPSPHMPHLMFASVLRRARARFADRRIDVVPLPGGVDSPYDRAGTDHTRYVSFADWVCPTHCIEPAICPAIGQARTWEMPDAVRALAERLRAGGSRVLGPALFICRHHVFGVGTFAVESVVAADRLVAQAAAEAEPVSVLIGTVSACHGALNLVRLGR